MANNILPYKQHYREDEIRIKNLLWLGIYLCETLDHFITELKKSNSLNESVKRIESFNSVLFAKNKWTNLFLMANKEVNS